MKLKTKILSIVVPLLLVVLVVVANVWRRQSMVRDIKVEIDYCGAEPLVSGPQIAGLIEQQMPDIHAKMVRDLDLSAVETAAAASPYLSQCDAGTSIGGGVVVYAVQRRPIVRVVSGGGEYYLDDKGVRVPMSPTGSCDVIVASGNIPTKGKGLNEVWTLARYLDRHPEVGPLFDQIYRDASGDLFLTPKLGSHVVQVGSVERLDEKFANLLALYTRGLSQAGWETYSQVSLKYKGQVVCTKRNNN